MSFSHPDFAAFVQDRFEPTWERVREVPRVTIDFGGGAVVRRTLHGNVATYVCLPNGTVVDVIPGLYDRATFRTRLEEAADLVARTLALPTDERVLAVRRHHAGQLLRRAVGDVRAEPAAAPRTGGGGASKGVIERPVEVTVAGRRPAPPPLGTKDRIERPVEHGVVGLRTLPDLSRDTEKNEAHRRPAVHRILAEDGPWRVVGLTKRIYRDVLGTDLDDPYLGLGETLFATYPFVR